MLNKKNKVEIIYGKIRDVKLRDYFLFGHRLLDAECIWAGGGGGEGSSQQGATLKFNNSRVDYALQHRGSA